MQIKDAGPVMNLLTAQLPGCQSSISRSQAQSHMFIDHKITAMHTHENEIKHC
jgi:hypothetical protein